MKKNLKRKKLPEDPNIEYLERLWDDPKFIKGYQKARLRFGIAIEIARLRQKKKITQHQLACLTKTDQAVISRIERGRANLSLDRLAEIAAALGVKAKIQLV
ncbi:helix-turn-helix transcriptional regulator [Candidatus Peregrinibacteria bacterium]|nr:helix-turn-helix transcriptional regulator [Candidatus Peregrinibacteria bacterium]